MKKILSLLIFLGIFLIFLQGVLAETINIREECQDNNEEYNLYPTRINIISETECIYEGYVNYWEWKNIQPNVWRAKYNLWIMQSDDRGLTWSCPSPLQTQISDDEYIWAGPIKDNSFQSFSSFVPLSKASDIETYPCGWSNAQGVEQTCQLWFEVGDSVIYLADENWNIDKNPLIGYHGTADQKQILLQEGYKVENRRYEEIYHPLPVRLGDSSDAMHLYFGGWKGELTQGEPEITCPGQDEEYTSSENKNYKYCNCFKYWEDNFGQGWWDEAPYDLCTGDKIFYATNKNNLYTDPKNFDVYSGDAKNLFDNELNGHPWASENWQPIIWAEALRTKCSHVICQDTVAVQNGGAAIKLPNGKIALYFTLYRDTNKFPEENERGGIITVATSNDGIHFLNSPNKIKPLESNWPTGDYGYSWDAYGARYDPDLGKIIMIANLYLNLNESLVKPYRILIDPSNPYVAESITQITPIKTIQENNTQPNQTQPSPEVFCSKQEHAGNLRCSPVYNAYDICQEYQGQYQWLLKDYCAENEVCINSQCVSSENKIPAFCNDTDKGLDYYRQGVVRNFDSNNNLISYIGEYCQNESYVLESYCSEENTIKQKSYFCQNGCFDGFCEGIQPANESPTILNETELNISFEEGGIFIDSYCGGCLIENNCYAFGYRKGNDFCDETKDWLSQKDSGSVCENNFQCESNICIDNECISLNVWQKFINWLKTIFG